MCLLFSDVHLTYQIPEMDGLYQGLSVFTLNFLPNTPQLIESWFSGSANSYNNNTTRLLIFESQLATNNDRFLKILVASLLSLLYLGLFIQLSFSFLGN